jgi:hypothetical protein
MLFTPAELKLFTGALDADYPLNMLLAGGCGGGGGGGGCF